LVGVGVSCAVILLIHYSYLHIILKYYFPLMVSE
jgi:hypothetical protein